MNRKHLPTLIYITLLVAAALPYGVFVGLFRVPLVLSLILCGLTGVVIAIVVDPLSRAIVRRVEERHRVRDYGRAVAAAPICAHCGVPILGTSVSAPTAPAGPVVHWHMDAGHPMCRDAFAASRTRGAAS